MQILNVHQIGRDYEYKLPSGDLEIYHDWIEYRAAGEDGQHIIRIDFGHRLAYSQDRIRVVVWIDGHPHPSPYNAGWPSLKFL